MTAPMSWGPSRTGYFEVVRGANLVNEDAFTCKANNGNDSGVEDFDEGEWALVDGNGQAIKSTASTTPFELLAYPVVIGHERSDVRGSKSTTLALGVGYWIETSGWDSTTKTADDYPAGTECCIKSGKLYPAVSGNYVRAVVKRAASSRQTMAQRALQKSAFTTLLVEVVSPYVKA